MTLWTGVVVLRGMVIREWLQGRELNPRRQGYESRLGTGLPAVELERVVDVEDQLEVLLEPFATIFVPFLDGCLAGLTRPPTADAVE